MHGQDLTNPNIIDVSHQIVASDLGNHYALLYSHLPVLKQFYCEYVLREMQYYEGCILFLTFYETTRQVKLNLANANIDVSRHEQDGSLKIFDTLGFLFGRYPYQLNLTPLRLILDQLQRIAMNKGVSLLIDISPFYHLGKIEELVKFEELFAFDFFRQNRKVICLYRQQNIECLPLIQRKELAKHHTNIFRS